MYVHVFVCIYVYICIHVCVVKIMLECISLKIRKPISTFYQIIYLLYYNVTEICKSVKSNLKLSILTGAFYKTFTQARTNKFCKTFYQIWSYTSYNRIMNSHTRISH